ncbi:MAG TPA: tRNA (adenosine(37)-N6)-threonylcarbamoyltransferase complex ATPase subunit type 1 TsaE [Candidatus Eisenbacteria bacterium]|nr:tRNA (adenosine(37)-N6)-threonylcarbamoyltransferase complex ATPase subunit type 1 TsaE [Candidatus Eisenbacteria bacterium]
MTLPRRKAARAVRIESRSASETRRLGRAVGRFLRAGDVVALAGELGAGKTTFAKGVAEGLGADGSEVVSPTFVLINEYGGREKIFHMDWYRLDRVEGRDRELALECFDAGAVSLVEWPARGKGVVPADALRVTLEHAGRTANSRVLRFAASGTRFAPVLAALSAKKRAG